MGIGRNGFLFFDLVESQGRGGQGRVIGVVVRGRGREGAGPV